MTKRAPPTEYMAMRYDPPDAFISALAAGAAVELYDGPVNAAWLAFTLQSGGAAIHVVTPEGKIVGVFATALAAAVHGFRRLDRAAHKQINTSPRRARRGTVRKPKP